MRILRLSFIVVAIALMVGTQGGAATAKTAAKPAPARVVAFYDPTVPGAYQSLTANGRRISIVADERFGINATTLAMADTSPDPGVWSLAAADGFQVWPVYNLALPATSTVFAQPALEEQLAGRIAASAHTLGAPGVFVDVEGFPQAQAAGYASFVSQLAAQLHGAGQKLGVYVTYQISGMSATAPTKRYDWAQISAAADITLEAGYSITDESTAPGSEMTTRRISDILTYSQPRLPAGRWGVILGTIAYDWQTSPAGPARALWSNRAEAQRPTGARITRPDPTGDPTYSYRDRGGATHVVYWQDASALAAQAQLLEQAQSGYVGVFLLGGEPAGFWQQAHI